jgi:hypothetical protein
MRANEFTSEGIGNTVGNVAGSIGRGIGRTARAGADTVGAVAQTTSNAVKNATSAAGKFATSAVDALKGDLPSKGTGTDILKTATGTLLPKHGDQIYMKDPAGFERIWFVTSTDEKGLQVEIAPMRRLSDKGRLDYKPVVLSLSNFNTLKKVPEKTK